MSSNVYIRAGATGTDDGSDWTNAKPTLPTTLVRDTVYYIADGGYLGHFFEEAVDGTKWIVLRKATEGDHGTSTGWNSSYGDDYAYFDHPEGNGQPVFRINTSYIEVDGVVGGGPGSWFTGHGFILRGSKSSLITFSFKGGAPSEINDVSNFKIKHCYLGYGNPDVQAYPNGGDPYGLDDPSLPNAGEGWCAMDASAQGKPTIENFEVSYCYSYGSYFHAYLSGCRDFVFEYNAFRDSAATSSFHAPQIRMDGGLRGTYRYNLFYDPFSDEQGGTGVLTFFTGNHTDVKVYGNIFARPEGRSGGVGGGWITTTTSDAVSVVNLEVHNNTFINSPDQKIIRLKTPGADSLPLVVTNCSARNNLFYSTVDGDHPDYHSDMAHDYNFHADPGGTNGEVNGQDGGASDPFVDWENEDFSLTSNTDAGEDLGSEFETDMLGNARVSWTRGAVEYNGTPPAPDTTDPVAVSFSPLDGETEAGVDSPLVLTFNEAIALGSGNVTIKNLDAPSQDVIDVVGAQIEVFGSSLKITPAADLAYGTNYAIQIDATAVDDLAGNSFAGVLNDTTWNFTAESAPPPPADPTRRSRVMRLLF